MGKNHANNRGRAASGVDPQGNDQDITADTSPKSQLENAAKRKNTK